jgi:hypothetical protein
MMRLLARAVVLPMFLLLAASAFANSGELLSFQGLGSLQQVGNFYNGAGLSSTPNYGVTFSSNFFGLRAPPGVFSPTPTGTPAIFMCPTCTAGTPTMGVMDVAPGFSNGLNFFYTAGFTNGATETMTIWSGVNGTGTVLATLTLSNNNGNCNYCTWSDIGVKFSGTAMSVTFSGPADQLGLADITLGSSTTAIPEPSSIYLMGTGLGVVSLGLRRFRRA